MTYASKVIQVDYARHATYTIIVETAHIQSRHLNTNVGIVTW